jgi:hypothetical protein
MHFATPHPPHAGSHPDQYHRHPPCFLAQSERSDFNADLCAGRVYHETLQAHGVLSELVLLPTSDALCTVLGLGLDLGVKGANRIICLLCLKPTCLWSNSICYSGVHLLTVVLVDAVSTLQAHVLVRRPAQQPREGALRWAKSVG